MLPASLRPARLLSFLSFLAAAFAGFDLAAFACLIWEIRKKKETRICEKFAHKFCTRLFLQSAVSTHFDSAYLLLLRVGKLIRNLNGTRASSCHFRGHREEVLTCPASSMNQFGNIIILPWVTAISKQLASGHSQKERFILGNVVTSIFSGAIT